MDDFVMSAHHLSYVSHDIKNQQSCNRQSSIKKKEDLIYIVLYMKYLLLLFWILAASGTQAQLRPETIALTTRLERVAINNQPRDTRGWHLVDSVAIALRQTATAAELLELTRHASPVVRATALFALLERTDRDSLDLHRLVPEHFHDTATIDIEVLEIVKFNKDVKVGALFLNTIGNLWFDGLWTGDGVKLNKLQKAWLDSVFICTNTAFNQHKLSLVSGEKWKPKPSFYPHIRQLVATGQDPYSSVFLAHYRQVEDIPLILAQLPPQTHPLHGNRWQPFRYFQHPDLFAFLKGELDNSWQNGSYMEAIAQYKNGEAAALLDSVYARIKLVKDKRSNPLSQLNNAILRNYAPVFADLYLRILTEFPETYFTNIPDGLWATHADTLCRLYSVWKNGGRTAKDRALKMMPKVIEHLQKSDTGALNREIISRIVPGLEMNTYSEHPADRAATVQAYLHIYKTRHPAFIEPLFDVLKKEPLGKNRFFIAKLLLRFDQAAMRERLTQFFKENPSLAPSLKDAEEGGAFYSNFVHKAEQQ
jgi:hypothetical protein